MKTQFNQLITIVSFFSLSIGATLAISWGMFSVVFDEVSNQELLQERLQEPLQEIIVIKSHPKINIDLSKHLRVLLPRSAPSPRG